MDSLGSEGAFIKEHIFLRNRALFLGDLILIVVSVFASFALRLELGNLFFYFLPQAIWMAVIAVIVKPLVYYQFGLYRRLWAYASTREITLIASAVSMGSILVGTGVILLSLVQIALGDHLGFPRSIPLIDWVLSLLFVGALRFSLRMINDYMGNTDRKNGGAKRVAIVGAGSAGNLVVRELMRNPQLNLVPVSFLDDDSSKHQHEVQGVPIEGGLEALERVVRARRVEEVIIAIPSAPGRIVRRVAEACQQANVPYRTMPGIYELLGGSINISRLRDVNITDLLRRRPVQIDRDLVGPSLSGKTVLISGAGGSIGRELCRQVAQWGPAEIVMLGHGENSIFEAVFELRQAFPTLPIHPVIADVRDSNRLFTVFEKNRPEVVFHAAAHKHVTLMETNVEEAVTNNILGTRNITDMAVTFDVQRLVMVSTDKAVHPTSVMGATKRIAEMLVIDTANRTGLPYSVVRFGNVLGSRGSIVPIFKQQIARGGPVTVTHPEMKRYFMTIPEAVHLVLQASAMGQGGEVFVLNMGNQIKILALAEDLIRLSGLEPEKDVEIVFTGIRPGEKIQEELWENRTDIRPTAHSEVMRMTRDEPVSGIDLTQAVGELIYLAREGDSTAILHLLDKLIPGATVSSTPPTELASVI
jgi:FlaA1/EpsC-like NDP-sugar epimerase